MSSSPTVPKEDEADIPKEMAGGDEKAVEEPSNGSGSVLTTAMLEEEERLHQETVTKEEELRKQTTQASAEPQEAKDDLAEQRYNRLKFLLSKSNMYTTYLVKRMERQTVDEQQLRQRRERRLQKEMERQKSRQKAQAEKQSQPEAKDEQQENTSRTRRGNKTEPPAPELRSPRSRRSTLPPPTSSPQPSTRSPRVSRSAKNSPAVNSSSQENKESPAMSRRKGRKRKAENLDSYRIADYFDKALAASKNDCDKAGDGETDSQDDDAAAPVAKKQRKASEDASHGANQKESVANGPAVTTEETDVSVKPSEDQAKLDRIITENTAEQIDEDGDDDAPVPDRYINGELVSPDQPSLLSGGVLRPYQVEGFNWLKVIYENGINGILADEMGLGKTIQCIAAVSYLVQQGVPGPYLVCAPLSTVPNWVAEFARFAPMIPCILYHGTKDERAALRSKVRKLHPVIDDIRSYPVVVTSYEITMNDRAHMQNFAWKYIIVDEGHRIKNFQCRLIRELKQYRATHRLLLTGTPLQNNLAELWSLLNFLLPEIFDDLTSFETWFDLDSLQTDDGHSRIVAEEKRKNILGMLHQILMPFMLRRLKTDVDLVIPPKREVLVYAPLTEKQEKYYRAAVDNSIKSLVQAKKAFKIEVLTDTSNQSPGGRQQRKATKKVNYSLMMAGEDEDEEGDVEEWAEAVAEAGEKEKAEKAEDEEPPTFDINIKVRNIVMLLRKACNHPYLLEYPLTKQGDFRIDNDIVKASGKFMLLDRMLPELRKGGHKVLIFSQMTSVLDVIGDYCYMRGWMYSRLDGSMHVTDRKVQMEHFNEDPDVFLFLLSTRAGGLGINLTAADTVIIFDSDWNPQADLQAQDRCHRIGQTRPVMIYRFITANTIDQKIVERAAAKRRLEKMVMLKGKFKEGIKRFRAEVTSINPTELLQLLKSRDFDAEVRGRQGQVISDQELDNLLDRSDLQAAYEQRKAGKTLKKTKTEMVDIEGVFKVVSEDLGGAMDEDATSEPDSTNDKTDVNHNELLTEEPVDATES